MRRVYHSLWNSAAPVQTNQSSGTRILVALAFVPTQAGAIAAARFFRDATDGENHVYWFVHQTQALVAFVERAGAFKRVLPPTSPGNWQTLWFHPWLPVVANDLYELIVLFNAGRYANMVAAHSPDTDTVVGPLTIPRAGGTVVTNNGLTSTTLTLLPGTAIGNAKPALDLWFHIDGDQ